MKTPSFEVIAGTYEEYLLGYRFTRKQTELVQSFASHNHSGSIRCVAASGHYLASGASDDRIIIYDLKSRKEQCMLTHHEATINCIKFTENHSHLISGSADGVLSIVRVGNWQLEKKWDKAHKGSAILDIAVHPSGKLALTLGSDCSLRTWNLVKGRQAYVINLNSKSKDAKSLDRIIWAEDGIRFILFGGKNTEIWSIDTGGILKIIEHEEKVSSCIWLTDNEILVGYENGQIAKITVDDCVKDIQSAHNGRVKALAKYGKWIVSCSSTGEITVWSKHFEVLAKHNSGCRVTCIAIVPNVKVKSEQREDELQVTEEIIHTPIKKGTVVMEVESSDNESVIFMSQQNNTKKGVVKESEVKLKKKKKKRISDDGVETEGHIKRKKSRKIASKELEKQNELNLIYIKSDNDHTKSIQNVLKKNKKKKSRKLVAH